MSLEGNQLASLVPSPSSCARAGRSASRVSFRLGGGGQKDYLNIIGGGVRGHAPLEILGPLRLILVCGYLVSD